MQKKIFLALILFLGIISIIPVISAYTSPSDIYLTNPTLDSDISGWSVTGNTTARFEYSTTTPKSGAGAAELSPPNPCWGEIYQVLSPITPDDFLNFTGWARISSEGPIYPSVIFFIQWLDDLDDQVGTNETTQYQGNVNWDNQFSVSGNAPALATKVKLGVKGITAGDAIWLDEFDLSGDGVAEFSRLSTFTSLLIVVSPIVIILILKTKNRKK